LPLFSRDTRSSTAVGIVLAFLAVNTFGHAASGAPAFVDAEQDLRQAFGDDLGIVPSELVSRAIVRLAESLPPNGAIDLPWSVPCKTLDLRRVADGVQITGGWGGQVILGGGQRGIHLLFSRLDQAITTGIRRTPDAVLPDGLFAGVDPQFKNVLVFDKGAPASDLLALFCSGAIQIDHDVKHCAWIAGDNAFGRRTVTANARVDDCLFLWFGINWPFADYNAHWGPANKGKNWLDNAQMWLNCKGGGQGTRLYLMIETNYGNPGPGVVLENCTGMALYHGSTERASSQGPGTYWLKNCTTTQLGLRGINAFMIPGHPRSPEPAHDITIAGGSRNVLHGIRTWGYASGASAVNSEPDLQVWMGSFQYETQGFDGPGILRFAYTPHIEKPTPDALQKIQATVSEKARKLLDSRKQPVTEERLKLAEQQFLSSRHAEQALNARDEQTFRFGEDDLTKEPASLRNGRKLPPPPSIPATNAPRLRRPVAFAQAGGFGKAILDAGADPTGQRPSDDAFAQVMFGMSRDQAEDLLQQTYRADADFRSARAANIQDGMKTAREKLDQALNRLHPFEDPAGKASGGKRPRVRRPRLEIPPGTYLLRRPLVLVRLSPSPGSDASLWGAGPDRTVLRTDQDIKVIEQHAMGTIANLTVEGGRVGLAITGADHDDAVSPTLHSYIAGQNYYGLTFRDQTFAGIHVGNDDPAAMGGAEHDQNRYVDLRFIHTGRYGIFMNQNMLDKWLLLHAEFVGQSTAGIAIQYSNLIHGAVIDCTFRDINGPGIDFFGGNATIAYRPWLVMVDQCQFTECGNADSPAVDQGYGELMSFTRCRIETKGKTVRCGYIGSAQHYEDVDIDIRTPAGSPAMLLRAVRNVKTAYTNGHILRGVRATGPVGFIQDTNTRDEMYRKTLARYGKPVAEGTPVRIGWDSNPAAHDLAPTNGWVYPFLFYNCRFGEKSYGYSLLNVDPAAEKVIEEIDLRRLAD